MQSLGLPLQGAAKAPDNIFSAMCTILKDVSEEDVLLMMLARLGRLPKPDGSVLDTEAAEAVMEEGDAEEAKRHDAQEQKLQVEGKDECAQATTFIVSRLHAARAKVASSLKSPSAAAAHAGVFSTKPVLRENFEGAWSKEEVDAYMPPGGTYRPVRDPRNGRWYVFHTVFGTSCSRSWGMRSESRCVQIILQWAWNSEARLLGHPAGQQLCPHHWVFAQGIVD